jgi:thiol-disulfide isomerase/thioredoxin
MNRLAAILLLITVFSFQFVLATVINISAPDYKNETIIWKKKFDYLSNKYKILDQQIIDSNGKAKLIFDNNQIELTEISIGRSHGMLYVDTATSTYNLFIPKDTLINKASLQKSNIEFLFIDFKENDINNLILDFNLELDFFLYGDTNKIIRMAKHNKEFQDSLNVFKIYLSEKYKSYKIKYLHNYIRYEIALLEQLAHQSKGDYYKSYLFESYLKTNEINYNNDAYMQFFNIFFRDVFKVSGLAINDKIKFAINNYNELEKLKEAMINSRYFSNPKLTELAIIKGLYDAYYSTDYIAENIILFLKQIAKNSQWNLHRNIASNCIAEITKLRVGATCPDFEFFSLENSDFSVNNFKGKYTYINFFASWNNNSLHEMEVINQFQENYDFVNFISINLDYNLKSFKKLAGSLSYDSWPIVYPLNKQGLISYFELDHLPTHLLIDPNGDIYQYPALPPTALYNNKSIDATFFKIQKKLSPDKKYRIGKKD